MLLPPLRPFDYDCFCALQARAWVSGPYPLTILADSVGQGSGLILTTTFFCSQSFLRSHTCPFVARYVRFSCCPPALLRRPQMYWGTCIDEYMACGSAPYLNTSEVYLLLLDTLATYLQLCTACDADMWMLLLPIDRQASCLPGPSNIGNRKSLLFCGFVCHSWLPGLQVLPVFVPRPLRLVTTLKQWTVIGQSQSVAPECFSCSPLTLNTKCLKC